jgi:hypothetical protein
MLCKSILEPAKEKAFQVMLQAERKYKIALREYRASKAAHREARAAWLALHNVYSAIKDSQQRQLQGDDDVEGAVELDNEMVGKVSGMIRQRLLTVPGGLTLQQLSECLNIRKQTISATLYNMKKRDEIVHDEASGRYSIPARFIRPMQPK